MVFPYILYCGGQPLPTTIQNVWENHDFKKAISYDMWLGIIQLCISRYVFILVRKWWVFLRVFPKPVTFNQVSCIYLEPH